MPDGDSGYYDYPNSSSPPSSSADQGAPSQSQPSSNGGAGSSGMGLGGINLLPGIASAGTPQPEGGDGAQSTDALPINLDGSDMSNIPAALLNAALSNVEGGSDANDVDATLGVNTNAQDATIGAHTEGALISQLASGDPIVGSDLLSVSTDTGASTQDGGADGHSTDLVQIGLGDSQLDVAGATSATAPAEAGTSPVVLSLLGSGDVQSGGEANATLLGSLLASAPEAAETIGSPNAGSLDGLTGDGSAQQLLGNVGEHVDHLLAT